MWHGLSARRRLLRLLPGALSCPFSTFSRHLRALPSPTYFLAPYRACVATHSTSSSVHATSFYQTRNGSLLALLCDALNTAITKNCVSVLVLCNLPVEVGPLGFCNRGWTFIGASSRACAHSGKICTQEKYGWFTRLHTTYIIVYITHLPLQTIMLRQKGVLIMWVSRCPHFRTSCLRGSTV